MTERQAFPGLSSHDAGSPYNIARVVGGVLLGNLNAVIDYSVVEAGGSPKTVKDDRINDLSFIALMNLSAPPGNFWVSATRNGEADISWTVGGFGTTALRLLVIG